MSEFAYRVEVFTPHGNGEIEWFWISEDTDPQTCEYYAKSMSEWYAYPVRTIYHDSLTSTSVYVNGALVS